MSSKKVTKKKIPKNLNIPRARTAAYVATIKDSEMGDKLQFMPGRKVGTVELWRDGEILAAFWADDLAMMATLLEQIECPTAKEAA